MHVYTHTPRVCAQQLPSYHMASPWFLPPDLFVQLVSCCGGGVATTSLIKNFQPPLHWEDPSAKPLPRVVWEAQSCFVITGPLEAPLACSETWIPNAPILGERRGAGGAGGVRAWILGSPTGCPALVRHQMELRSPHLHSPEQCGLGRGTQYPAHQLASLPISFRSEQAPQALSVLLHQPPPQPSLSPSWPTVLPDHLAASLRQHL